MQVVSVKRTQFAGLNDKRFFFNYRIISLPFGHYLLNKVRKEKENIKTKYNIKYTTKKIIY